MKNIYKITKAQLISLWVFGVIGWFYFSDSYSDFSDFFMIFIPAILVFYTIGWHAQNKTQVDGLNKDSFKILSFLPNKKIIFISFISIVLILIVVSIVLYLINAKEERLRKEQLTQDYNQAILRLDPLKEELSSCLKPIYEKTYQEELRSCNLLLNKTKSDYRSCLGYSDRDWCLYNYDYEAIDCSEKTIRSKGNLRNSVLASYGACSSLTNELLNVNKTIEEYKRIYN